MFKRILLIFALIFSIAVTTANGRGFWPDISMDSEILSKHKRPPLQQLLDTATYYFNRGDHKKAQVYHDSLIKQTLLYPDDREARKIAGKAYYQVAVIHFSLDNYRLAYEKALNAIQIAEEFNDSSQLARNYIVVGNIYLQFNRYDLAKQYYSSALNLNQDPRTIFVLFNNLGYTELKIGENLDSAFYFLNQSLQAARENDAAILYANIGSYYQKKKHYDSAFAYYNLALENTGSYDYVREKANTLSNLGKLFFEMDQLDSAIFYIEQSNAVAGQHGILSVLTDNYLLLSKITRIKGQNAKAFEYLDQHLHLKDSLFNREKILEISELQRLHETAKTDRQIENLAIEKRTQRQIIFWQEVIFVLIVSALLFAYFQKRKSDKVNKILFEKSIEILNPQEKYKKSKLVEKTQDELLHKILAIMEDTPVICNPEFTVGTLAELTQSNYTYVSQVINNTTKKNFRSFLNSYRIREAQRLFSEQDAAKYTIEAVAFQVGFKSRSTFYEAFKEINGISPNFYLKSLQKTISL